MGDLVTIILPRGSCWMRYRVIPEFVGFPNDIAGIIVGYLQILKLRDWISCDRLDMDVMLMNSDAFAADMILDIENADPYYLVENPYAIDFIKLHADKFIGKDDKWKNPRVVEWLFSLGIYPEVSEYLATAPSKIAIDKVISMNIKDPDKAVYELSENPMAIDLIRNNLHAIDQDSIWKNSAAIDILVNMITSGKEIIWKYLSHNESEWAMSMLQENQDKIDWVSISCNRLIFEPAANPNKKELMCILTGCGEVGNFTEVQTKIQRLN